LTNDESVFSSGDYRRNFTKNGKSYHHIIDPRTGYPSENARAITVVHSKGSVADAAATALMVANEDQWLDIAKNIGLTHLLVVDKDGKLYSDKLFAERLHLSDEKMTIKILGTL
ncbi:MAG: FAD:protein FMN transferase, partial [Gammaproteobacteria bacterium]